MNGTQALAEFMKRLDESTRGTLDSIEDASEVQFAAVIRLPGVGFKLAAFVNSTGQADERQQLIDLFERAVVNLQQVQPIRYQRGEPIE